MMMLRRLLIPLKYINNPVVGTNGYEFCFASDPNSYDIGGWSDDYGICRVSFAPSFIGWRFRFD